MHQQLYNTSDDVDQTLYFLNGHGNILSYASGTNYTYFLELPFYFYRNPSLAIPTCALTKQVVEVRIKLRPLSELIFPVDLICGMMLLQFPSSRWIQSLSMYPQMKVIS